jgi:hypothetical protein
MKQIILGLLFVIGMMGNMKAQERRTPVNRAYDFLGTLDKNTQIAELNNLSQQIKNTKDWEVIMTTVSQASQYVTFNNIQFMRILG